jgi:hypothetical protein
MTVLIDDQRVGDTYRPLPRYAPDILETEFEQDLMLGEFFLIGQEIAGERGILLLGPPPRARPSDSAASSPLILYPGATAGHRCRAGRDLSNGRHHSPRI